MINNKKIEEAAGAFVAHRRFLDTMTKNDLVCGFKQGANWAIKEFLKDLWHDAREEPEKDKFIIEKILDEIGEAYEVGVFHPINTKWVWAQHIKDYDVISWCYLEDILP